MLKRLLLLVFLVAVMAACARNTLDPQETPVPTQAPSATATKTATPTKAPPTATATVEPSPTATATLAPFDIGPDNFPPDVNPLTGLPVADPELLERRPLAVKVQLFPRFGRPPFGINSADIVHEFYQNGGITRLHAIFYGQDAEQIGPIRSARFPDHELILMYKSIFAYGSADARVNNRLFNASYSPWLVLEGATSLCPPTEKAPMCRFNPSGPNHLLTGTEALSKYTEDQNLDNSRQNLDGMRFASNPPEGGSAGTQLSIRYSADSYNRWEYEAVSGRYVRYQDVKLDDGSGEEYELLIDRTTEEPVSADNVVVVVAAHSYYLRNATAELVEINLTGFGKAYVFRDGQMFEASWGRPALDSVMSVYYSDGSRFPLKPGNTWFQIVGQSSTVTRPEEGSLRVQFAIP